MIIIRGLIHCKLGSKQWAFFMYSHERFLRMCLRKKNAKKHLLLTSKWTKNFEHF